MRVSELVTERDALQTKANDEGRSKDPDEREKFKELTEKIASAKDEIADLKLLEESNKAAATVVNGESTKAASDSRSGNVQVRR